MCSTSDEKEETAEEELHSVTSPIVGTFYRSPSPDTDPFVEVGARVVVFALPDAIEATAEYFD